MRGQYLEHSEGEPARASMPKVVPSDCFVQRLGKDIRRTARQRMGYSAGVPFEEMVIELRKLVRLLCQTLVPIQPRADFVSTLRGSLQVTATQQFADRERRIRWLMVGGVVGSVISLIGVAAALVLWRRNGRVHSKKPLGVA